MIQCSSEQRHRYRASCARVNPTREDGDRLLVHTKAPREEFERVDVRWFFSHKQTD
jgi:hypothetical protein